MLRKLLVGGTEIGTVAGMAADWQRRTLEYVKTILFSVCIGTQLIWINNTSIPSFSHSLCSFSILFSICIPPFCSFLSSVLFCKLSDMDLIHYFKHYKLQQPKIMSIWQRFKAKPIMIINHHIATIYVRIVVIPITPKMNVGITMD